KDIPKPLEEMRADELARHFHDLEQQLLSRWNAPLVNDFFAMIYFGVLRSLTRKWCDDESGTLQNGLLCGIGNIVSAEPARRIREMAVTTQKHPDLISKLTEADRRELESAILKFPDFHAKYTAYLERFSDRCLNELKLESPTLKDDPVPLLRSVGSLARRLASGKTDTGPREGQVQKQAEDE